MTKVKVYVTSLSHGKLLRVFDPQSPAPPYPTDYMYIGREVGNDLDGSPLQNPFHLRDERDRGAVIADYRRWLWEKIRNGPDDNPVFQELLKVLRLSLRPQGVALACWCAPKPCHGQVVREAVQTLYESGWR